MPRRGRGAARAARAARAAARAARTAVAKPKPEAEDDEMVDAPSTPQNDDESEVIHHEPQTPKQDESQSEQEKEQEQEQEDVAPSPTPSPAAQQGSERVRSENEEQSPAAGRVSAIVPRKRRIGRPPKHRPPEDRAAVAAARDGSPSTPASTRGLGTPGRRRGRGRPSAGGRWSRARGGPSHVTQVPVDKEGNKLNVLNDEVELPEDPAGENKVDNLGNLLGGREYRVRIFTILNKGDRQYMLSTEPARCIGFRDSYLFFQKHQLLYKIIIDDDAKRDLIKRDIIPHSYKGRAIGVVTARSVFREFGAKIVIGGRKVMDDYYETAARQRGDIDGELAVPDDRLPRPGEKYDRNRYVAWHGASAVYHTGVPTVPIPSGKIVDPKKRKITLTDDNWMLEHAKAASEYNNALLKLRQETLDGVYDIHTNIIHYPRIMQPTHARWEPVPPSDVSLRQKLAGLDISPPTPAAQQLPNGVDGGTLHENDQSPTGENSSTPAHAGEQNEQPSASTIFPTVPREISRNFSVHDICYETPEHPAVGYPGPDGDLLEVHGDPDEFSLWPPGPRLDTDSSILALLPPGCREAYLEAAKHRAEWKSRWAGETTNGSRARPIPSYSWNP